MILRKEHWLTLVTNHLHVGHEELLLRDIDIGGLTVDDGYLGRHHHIGLRMGLDGVHEFVHLGVREKCESRRLFGA